ncbi:hypothetical protein WR25_09313 [Diploscapter pachys]|uniref:Rho-GAP domain-containing protein n=1 Tax=Diploscapter pachys TaxID=2018661 RepID=A0A2A2L551_9BILA|nr:hypothetical protein WR25_09313 [Diploscapter pachys]
MDLPQSSASSSTSLLDGTLLQDHKSIGNRKLLKEGAVQLTSLSSLLSYHRYFFLYNDLLIMSKQKSEGNFKLKEKLSLESVWIACSSTSDSFIVGWPLTNYLAHFRSNAERDDWYRILSHCIQQCTRPLSTTICMDISVKGRKQIIRRRLDNGKKAAELVMETANELGLPHNCYELRLIAGENIGKPMQGPENVYTVVMKYIEKSGVRLSDSQKQSLDTCPIANVKLLLSNTKSTKNSSPKQIVNRIKKRVLARTDSRGIFGKELDDPTPPQPIMTIVDHLRMKGFDQEGIFRKSPKQSTFKELKVELEKGLVPDYNKYNTHVLASMLKEYLRSIPGKILLSGNYELWIREVVDEEDFEKKLQSARNLLSLLPSSHSILLANLLKLLSQIANSPSSKMTSSSLSVCLAPSFLDGADQMEGGKKIPPLVEFLIDNAAAVMPRVVAESLYANSTDYNANEIALCSPAPSSSSSHASQRTPIIEEMKGTSTMQRHKDDALTFTDSDEENGNDDKNTLPIRPFSRSSFVSETLRSERNKTDEKSTSSEKKETSPTLNVTSTSVNRETPRSPCLKRIHFQRNSELLKYDARYSNTSPSLTNTRRESRLVDDVIPARKQSKEEATQTIETSLNGVSASAPQPLPASIATPQLAQRLSHSPVPTDPSTSELSGDRTKQGSVNGKADEQAKPTVQVAPFTQEQPSLRTISDRLAQLRRNNLDVREDSPRFIRKNYFGTALLGCMAPNVANPSPPVGMTEAWRRHSVDTVPTSLRDKEEPLMPELDSSLKRLPSSPQALPTGSIGSTPPVVAPRPPIAPRPSLQPDRPDPTVHLQRSVSQRERKHDANGNSVQVQQREMGRSVSVKPGRRATSTAVLAPSLAQSAFAPNGIPPCVGMDSLEINWSVSQLKSIFQNSTKAPAIDTDYTLRLAH